MFEVVPGLLIGTRLDPTSDYLTLGGDVIVDLEDCRGPSVDGFPALGNASFVDWLRSEEVGSEPRA